MPLNNLNFDASLQWETQTSITGFNPRIQDGSEVFSAESTLPSGSVSFWNQLNAVQLTLNPNTSSTLDCYSFTNLSAGAVTATAALGLLILPTGGDVTVTPGASNPLNWFFHGASTGTTAGVVVPRSGFLGISLPGSDTGSMSVNATTRNLLFINGHGSNTATVTVCVAEAGNNN